MGDARVGVPLGVGVPVGVGDDRGPCRTRRRRAAAAGGSEVIQSRCAADSA